MPLYDLRCKGCGAEDERVIALADFDRAIPCDCGATMHRVIRPLQIMADIQPYQAVGRDIATGNAPVITSRAHHREYLKRNGYEEVGNDIPKRRADEPINTKEIGKQIKQVIDQKGIRL